MKFRPYACSEEIAENFPGAELFDSRHDFLIDNQLSALALLMTFSNERALFSITKGGVRRKVSVSIIDTTEKHLLHTKIINVNLGRYEEFITLRVDLPLTYAEINTTHTYQVAMRDECSHRMLGREYLRLFDREKCGRNVADWFTIQTGGISPYCSHNLYRALPAESMTYHTACFKFGLAFREMPFILPETEVQVHYPNGKTETRFCDIECDDFDTNEYHIEMPFLVQDTNKGVCYAELRCMAEPVAGFVFNTNADVDDREFTGSDLKYLENYSPADAADRLREEPENTENDTNETDNTTDDEFERALQDFIFSQYSDSEKSEPQEYEESIPEEPVTVLNELDHLTGLNEVKSKISSYEKLVRFNCLRSDHNLPADTLPLHAMFLGSPGTGKTTVAKLMGSMLNRAGVLSSGHVVIKERSTLMGPYYGDEEINTRKAIEEARGGILFIDEAYQLYQPEDPRDPGKFVIETLMTVMADESQRDWMLILAGYSDEMIRMFEMNPGLKSRIPDSNIYRFDDFSENELMQIAENYLARNNFRLSPHAFETLSQRLANDYLARDKSFGNARHVINLIQTEILPAMAARVTACESITTELLTTIEPSDIPLPSQKNQARSSYIGFRA